MKRLMRGMPELTRARDALQDVLVGDDPVSDKLDRRAGQISQVFVQNGLHALPRDVRFLTEYCFQRSHTAYTVVPSAYWTVAVLDGGGIESASERPLTGGGQVNVFKDDDAVRIQQLFDTAAREKEHDLALYSRYRGGRPAS